MADTDEIMDRVQASVAGAWPAGERFVLAASGGGDSTAMVSLLCEAGLVVPGRAVVAHFDHRLRDGAGSAGERAAVEAVCARYGLQLETGAWETPRGGEAAAREARYAFLRGVARRSGATAVATGHTSDDQVETVVMHSLRGAGLHGLAGMAPEGRWAFGDGPRLLRPLLCVSREETRAYCAALGLTFADDPSNDSRSFLRNRVRHELLPRLEAMAPGSREALLRLAEDARDGVAALEAVAADALLDDEPHDGMLCLSRDALRALPPAVVPYAYRLALVRLRGDARDIERRHYGVLARAASAATGSTFELPKGVVVTVDPDAVVVSIGAPRVGRIDEAELPLPFEGVVGSWSLSVTGASGDRRDALRLPAGAVVRGRRPGDRLQLAGMRAGRAGGHKKLQDFYVDGKVPRRERDAAPVIAVGRDVLWTPFGSAAESDEGDAFCVRCERVGGVIP